jgi:hypothetical protein
MSGEDDPCATPNTMVTRRSAPRPLRARDRVAGLGPFAGHWAVHGSRMDLRSRGRSEVSTSFNSVGPYGTVETDTVRWTRYRNPDRLLLVVTDVRYEDGTGTPVSEPSDACWLADGSVQPGDSSLLWIAAPHLLEDMILVSHASPINVEGENGYWCGEGLATRYQYHCGA